MIIDKETGDIIFSGGQVIKAGMSVEELKASSVMELVTEKGKKWLEEGKSYTSLKVPDVHGHTLYMDVSMYDDRIADISITLGDYYDFYSKHAYNLEEYKKVEKIQRDFLKKVLQEYVVPNESRYKWGRIEMLADYRDTALLEIGIYYRLGVFTELC